MSGCGKRPARIARATCEMSRHAPPRRAEDLHRRSAAGDLIHRALLRRLVRSPAEKLRAVAEPPLGEVVVLNFDDQLRVERFPFAAALGAPARRAARRAAGEAAALLSCLAQLFDFGRQVRALLGGECRAEADVVEQSVAIIQPEQE